MEPTPTPSSTPQPAPAPAPAPAAVPPPVPPPAAPAPAGGEMADGGEMNKKIDWIQTGFLMLGTALLFTVGWYYVQKARQSRRLAETQEGLEARTAKLETIMAQMKSNSGGILPL